jgi:hypothetical protein
MTERDLRLLFGNFAVDALRAQLDAGASPQLDVGQLVANIAAAAPWVNVDALLTAAVDAELLERISTHRCASCGQTLDDEFVAAGECPHCAAVLTESENAPIPITLYVSKLPLSRSVPWLIAIHGFNTRGAWQETFSWLVASLYRYPAPVLTYKFGVLRPGVLFRWRHHMLVRLLGNKLRSAAAHANAQGLGGVPDVIAHSFGTLLFKLLLESDDFQDLTFGRVITIGSVIRPDFDWSQHIDAGRVEALLNVCGARDLAVPFAQFAIPGAGPGGKHGFVDRKVINVQRHGFGHSKALADDKLLGALQPGGDFERFLRLPLANFISEPTSGAKSWRAAPAGVRLLTWAAVMTIVLAAIALMAFIVVMGVRSAVCCLAS